jgi:ABC-type proline/glycine betaine transport system permease subunit
MKSIAYAIMAVGFTHFAMTFESRVFAAIAGVSIAIFFFHKKA